MCDHAHYDELKEEVKQHDRRLDALEKTDAVHETKFEALADSVKMMRNVMYTFALIMLLTIVWGAVGRDGFNAVTHAANINHATPSQTR